MSSDNTIAHFSEFVVAANINAKIATSGVIADRPVGVNSEMYSPQDIYVKTFDMGSCTFGLDICKIDVECKQTDEFVEFPFPPTRWSYWSFLSRKVEKKTNRDHDVYVLVDKKNSLRIFWITYGSIRQHYNSEISHNHKYVGERSSKFYRLPINDSKHSVQCGYDTLCEYLLSLRDGKVTMDVYGT